VRIRTEKRPAWRPETVYHLYKNKEQTMGTLEIVLGIVILVMGLAIVVAVLLQSGKDSQMSGVISGSAETFLGKERGSRLDKALNKVTPILSGIFAVLILVLYLLVSD
jgi:preprotein translocase subunit SecG